MVSAAEDIERVYDVEVTNEHITHVFYTTWSPGRTPTNLPSLHLSTLTIEQVGLSPN